MSTNAPDADAMIKQLATEYAGQLVHQIASYRALGRYQDHDFPDAELVRCTYQLLATGDIVLKEYTLSELKDLFQHYRWCLEQLADNSWWSSDVTGIQAMTDLCLFMEAARNCPRKGLRIPTTYWGVPFHRQIMANLKHPPELQELFERSIGRRRQQSIPAIAS